MNLPAFLLPPDAATSSRRQGCSTPALFTTCLLGEGRPDQYHPRGNSCCLAPTRTLPWQWPQESTCVARWCPHALQQAWSQAQLPHHRVCTAQSATYRDQENRRQPGAAGPGQGGARGALWMQRQSGPLHGVGLPTQDSVCTRWRGEG